MNVVMQIVKKVYKNSLYLQFLKSVREITVEALILVMFMTWTSKEECSKNNVKV